MTTSDGRFSRASAAAQKAVPRGISRSEGWYRLLVVAAQAVLMAFIWTCALHGWGIAMYVAFFFWIPLTISLTSYVGRHRGVLPRGFRRSHAWAAAWNLLVILVPGWLWMVEKVATPWPVPLLVALVGAAPLAWVTSRLVRDGR